MEEGEVRGSWNKMEQKNLINILKMITIFNSLKYFRTTYFERI